MKKRRMRTRKRTALHWLAALCLLITACHVLGLYCLTPERVLRRSEQAFFAGETVFLERVENPFSGPDLRLSGGPEAVILGEYGFSWQKGWYAEASVVGEREHDAPFTAKSYGVSHRDQQTNTYTNYPYVFGCLEDPAVTELEILFHAERGGYDQTARLTAEDWIVDENGDRFFLCALEPEVDCWEHSYTVTGFLADGTIAGTLQELNGQNRLE